jgi:hypothetical protein
MFDLQKSFKKAYLHFSRNNNQILALKVIRRLFRITFNYAISLELPNNVYLRDRHLESRELLDSQHSEIEVVSRKNEVSISVSTLYKTEFKYTLKDVLIDTESGISFVDVNNPKAILESSNILPIEVSDYLRPRKPKKIMVGTWIVLPARSYAHWLLQDLPRFIRLVQFHPEAQIVTKENPPLYVTSLLETLGIVPSLTKTVIRAEKQILIGTQYAVGVPSERDLMILKHFGEHLTSKNSVEKDYPKRVYISRTKSKRPLPNEYAIETSLTAIGYKVLHLEELDFLEQVQIFRHCEVILGAHGAGLTNIVWCQENAKIIEIYDPTFEQESIFTISVKLGLNYFRTTYNNFEEDLIGGLFD